MPGTLPAGGDRPMKAFILAAGLGTRLRPLTEELPKPAWPLFDVPLAAHVLRALAGAGAAETVVNLHHLSERLREALTPWIPPGLGVRWSPEPRILGTGGALLPWREFLADGPFLLLNADTYQDLDLAAMMRQHRARRSLATLSLRRLPPGSAAPIEVSEAGRIVRFLDARAPGAGPGAPCEFTGAHVLDPGVLARLPERPHCINADVHRAAVAEGAALAGYFPPPGSFWSDLGTPDRYVGAHRELLAAGVLPPGSLGRLVLGDETTEEGGEVRAPSYLGPGARVEEGGRAGPFGVLGAGAAVGRGGRAELCVLWAGARLEGAVCRAAVLSPSGARLEGGAP